MMNSGRLFLCCLFAFAMIRGSAFGAECSPVDQTRVADAVRAYLSVPKDLSIELVDSQPVGSTCWTKLMFEMTDSKQIRETLIYLSPDRRFLSRDLYGLEEGRVSAVPAQVEMLASMAGDGPHLGAASPKVTLVEFSDFQCPYCRETAKVLEQIAASDPNVRIVFRHMPLAMHPWALYAARAASCVKAGDFWKLHDFYFEKQHELNPENVAAKTREYVGTLGDVDLTEYDQCLASAGSLNAVRRDVRAAALLGVNGTPTVFANGKRLRATSTVEGLRNEVATATGITLQRSIEARTFLVFLRPTGRTVSPDVQASATTFLAELKKSGGLMSVGHAEPTGGDGGYDILTIRAESAAAAAKLISQSPLVVNGMMKPEVVALRQPADLTEH